MSVFVGADGRPLEAVSTLVKSSLVVASLAATRKKAATLTIINPTTTFCQPA